MNPGISAFKSRWGFHPCDYNFFLKLKSLHKWYWQALYDFHRWHRWQRRDEGNRVGPEPLYCPSFVEDKTWWKPVNHRGVAGSKVYPKTVVDRGVVELFQAARRPRCEPVEPFDEATMQRIDALYEMVETCFRQ